MPKTKVAEADPPPFYDPAWVIQAKDTDVRLFTLEQVECLANWCNNQQYDLTFGVPMQEVLDLYHASAAYDSFEGWLEEAPEKACAAYNRCVTDKRKHLEPR